MVDTELSTETEKLLAELEKIGQGQDFTEPPPPPPPSSDDLLDLPDLPPAPDPSDIFESVVTFGKQQQQQQQQQCVNMCCFYTLSCLGSPNKLQDLPPPPPSQQISKPPPPATHRGVTVNVRSTKLPPPNVASKTEKARAIGKATHQGGMTTTGQDGEGFISVSALKRQFERGPNRLTGTTITPVATWQQAHGQLFNLLFYGI